MKERQEKAKRDQKIFAASLAGLIVILTYVFMRDDLWWIMCALTYTAVVISVIFYELIDEAWVRSYIRGYTCSISEEPLMELRTETAIDVIS